MTAREMLSTISEYALIMLAELPEDDETNRGQGCRILPFRVSDEDMKIMLRRLDSRRETVKKSMTLNEWLEQWYETYVKNIIGSYRDHEKNIRVHIPDWIKIKPLTEVEPVDIQKVLNTKYLLDHSRTAVSVWGTINQALGRAERNRLIQYNPMRGVEKPKHENKVGEPLSKVQQREFFEKIRNHPVRNFFWFQIATGCRRSEGLRVRWSDIDFNAGTIHVPGTKTEKSNAVIAMTDEARYILERLPYTFPEDRLFHFRADWVTRQFKQLGIEGHSLKDLRHTFGTRVYEETHDLKLVQSQLRHASTQMTEKVYVHLAEEYKREQMKNVHLFPEQLKDDDE